MANGIGFIALVLVEMVMAPRDTWRYLMGDEPVSLRVRAEFAPGTPMRALMNWGASIHANLQIMRSVRRG